MVISFVTKHARRTFGTLINKIPQPHLENLLGWYNNLSWVKARTDREMARGVAEHQLLFNTAATHWTLVAPRCPFCTYSIEPGEPHLFCERQIALRISSLDVRSITAANLPSGPLRLTNTPWGDLDGFVVSGDRFDPILSIRLAAYTIEQARDILEGRGGVGDATWSLQFGAESYLYLEIDFIRADIELALTAAYDYITRRQETLAFEAQYSDEQLTEYANEVCPCGQTRATHYLMDGPCSHNKCGCQYFGQPVEEWETHTITNVGGEPGGFTIAE
jgi:hypothetical protein